jgi:hypothetical protein
LLMLGFSVASIALLLADANIFTLFHQSLRFGGELEKNWIDIGKTWELDVAGLVTCSDDLFTAAAVGLTNNRQHQHRRTYNQPSTPRSPSLTVLCGSSVELQLAWCSFG